jgi:carbonic anhydrase
MDYIFSVQNVVVVHHSFCGTTTLTPEQPTLGRIEHENELAVRALVEAEV